MDRCLNRQTIVLAFLLIGRPTLAMAQVPPNAHVVGGAWYCDDGFKKVAAACEKVIAPANARVIGSAWFCNDGFRKVAESCEKVVAPANARVIGGAWFCDDGFRKIAESCEKVVAPANARVIGAAWFCDDGFRKVAESCEQVIAPANAHVIGAAWFCDDGFRKAGSECVQMTQAEKVEADKRAAAIAKASETAYKGKVESDNGDILTLRNGGVVEVTSGYVGYIGYSKDAILFRSGTSWRIWIEGKRAFRCDVLKLPSGGATVVKEVTISRVAGNGAILFMTNGSVYEVDSSYTSETNSWSGSTALILADSEIINFDSGELVTVTKLR